MVPMERSYMYHREYSYEISKLWVKLQGQGHRVKKIMVPTRKGLITGNIHVKYQSSSTHCSKVISKVKVSERRTERPNDRMTDRKKTICPPILDLRGIIRILEAFFTFISIFKLLAGLITQSLSLSF